MMTERLLLWRASDGVVPCCGVVLFSFFGYIFTRTMGIWNRLELHWAQCSPLFGRSFYDGLHIQGR